MNVKPVKVQIVYEDGSTRESEIDRLSDAARAELAEMGILPTISKGDDGKKYVLIEWADGWREVYPAPVDVVDLRKYYVICREEKIGRIFLEKKAGYPELIEVKRNPSEVNKVTLI